MKVIPTDDPQRLVFRDDWGRFWRGLGWVLLPIPLLLACGNIVSFFPASQSTPAASAQPATVPSTQTVASDDPGRNVVLTVMCFGIVGWCFYRKWIIADRAAGTITVRRTVGPLRWTTRCRIDEFTHLQVRRREYSSKSGPRVAHTVTAHGPGAAFDLHTFDRDRFFEDRLSPSSFAHTLAGFCGYETNAA